MKVDKMQESYLLFDLFSSRFLNSPAAYKEDLHEKGKSGKERRSKK